MAPQTRLSTAEELAALPRPEAWLCDMDGVLVHENLALPGAREFLATLEHTNTPYLVLTNNSNFTRRDLSVRLRNSGLDIPEDRLWTSAIATAVFLAGQSPGGSAYVIGEAGLTTALHQEGFVMTETDPEYVVLGETRNYSFESITRAIRLIERGAKFIATNPDVSGPAPEGTLPATGAVAAMITKATNREPYFVGKPNPMMIRAGLNKINAHSETTAFVGDRMDTDMRAGLEAGLQTHLVLTGSTALADVGTYPFRPMAIHEGIGGVVGLIDQ